MPILGYKTKFLNLSGLNDTEFIIKFNVEYDDYGFFEKDKLDFDIGTYHDKVDRLSREINDKKFKARYDIGIYILSVCKYIVDKLPEASSVKVITSGMEDEYTKEEIIDSYNRIKNNTNYKLDIDNSDIYSIGDNMKINIFKVKITTLVPHDYVEKLIDNISKFNDNNGDINSFSSIKVTRPFIPNDIGEDKKIELVSEDKLEVICDIEIAKKIASEIKRVHPYEEPEIEIIPLIDIDDLK